MRIQEGTNCLYWHKFHVSIAQRAKGTLACAQNTWSQIFWRSLRVFHFRGVKKPGGVTFQGQGTREAAKNLAYCVCSINVTKVSWKYIPSHGRLKNMHETDLNYGHVPLTRLNSTSKNVPTNNQQEIVTPTTEFSGPRKIPGSSCNNFQGIVWFTSLPFSGRLVCWNQFNVSLWKEITEEHFENINKTDIEIISFQKSFLSKLSGQSFSKKTLCGLQQDSSKFYNRITSMEVHLNESFNNSVTLVRK